jgi:hypothetical protein
MNQTSPERLIAARYPSPEWAVFYEVGNATGFRTRRHADAVALGIWPSRGHRIVGFEVKRDRRDWLRELNNPAKAEDVSAHCDEWWLVTSSEAVARIDEIPDPWGWYVVDGAKLKTKRLAKQMGRDQEIVRRAFAAAMLRRVAETTVPKAQVRAQIEQALQIERQRSGKEGELAASSREVERLRAVLSEFKSRTGVDLECGWQGPQRISAAVDAVLRLDSSRVQIANVARSLEVATAAVQDVMRIWTVDREGGS